MKIYYMLLFFDDDDDFPYETSLDTCLSKAMKLVKEKIIECGAERAEVAIWEKTVCTDRAKLPDTLTQEMLKRMIEDDLVSSRQIASCYGSRVSNPKYGNYIMYETKTREYEDDTEQN